MRGATGEGAESRAYRFATETKKNTGTWSLGEMLGERNYHQERHIGFGLPTWSTEVNISMLVLPGNSNRSQGLAASDATSSSRTFAEHLSCSLKLLGFVPMHSDSQQCLNVAS